MKLEHDNSILISKLVELGAAGFINSSTSRSSPPPPGTTPTEIAAPNEGIPLSLAEDHLTQISPSPKDSGPQKGLSIGKNNFGCQIFEILWEGGNIWKLYFLGGVVVGGSWLEFMC